MTDLLLLTPVIVMLCLMSWDRFKGDPLDLLAWVSTLWPLVLAILAILAVIF